jgi:hypothetical protein
MGERNEAENTRQEQERSYVQANSLRPIRGTAAACSRADIRRRQPQLDGSLHKVNVMVSGQQFSKGHHFACERHRG